MRLFQNSGVYPSYLPRIRRRMRLRDSFAGRVGVFLDDRFGAAHFLQPVLQRAATAFFANGDDAETQRMWARENGLSASIQLEDILLAQIENHRTEVFYNLDPVRYPSSFIKRLPGSVRRSIAWRAAPSMQGLDFSAYHLLICNFPSILRSYQDAGLPNAYFAPAHDPEMNRYALNEDRPIDILFIGGYSRHHAHRAAVLQKMAALRDRYNVTFCLDRSRQTRLAESPLGMLGFFHNQRRPKEVVAVSHHPVFGRELYQMLSNSKIVINGAVDMAGADRGNMRCWEAMGCRAMLLSDRGIYPNEMENDFSMKLYSSPAEAVAISSACLTDSEERSRIADKGFNVISQKFSKASQWEKFCELVA